MKPTTPRRPVRFRPQLELLESRLQPGSLMSGLGAALADTTLAELNAPPASDHPTTHRLLRQEPANAASTPNQAGAGLSSSPSPNGRGAPAPVVAAVHPAAPSVQSLVDEMLALSAADRHAPLSRTTASAAPVTAHADSVSAGSVAPALKARASGMIAQPLPTQGAANAVVVLPNIVQPIPLQFATARHWHADNGNNPPPPTALGWATYVSGTGTSAAGLAVATDQNQNAYVAGSEGEGDAMMAFVAEYAVDGTPIYYTEFHAVDPDPGFTYGQTAAHALAVDPSGNAYVTGVAVRLETGNTQAFGMKLDANGNIVQGYGGGLATTPASNSSGDGIVVDANGQATLVGSAQVGQTQEIVAVAVKYNARGGAIPIYAAGYRFPGFDDSAAKAVALDATADHAYIVGSILPTGATATNILAFEIDNTGPMAGQHAVYAVSAQNAGPDVLNGVAVDGDGNAYIVGTVNAGGELAYAAEIDAAGDAFVYTWVFDDTLAGTGIDRDNANNLTYITGSGILPGDGLVHAVVGELDASGNVQDAYLTGGDTMDTGQGVAFNDGIAFMVGTTSSTNLSTDGTTLNGKSDAYLMAVSNFN